MEESGPAYAHAVEANGPQLVAQLDAELAALGPVRAPRSAGGLAGTTQERMVSSTVTRSPRTIPSPRRILSLMGST